MHDHDTPKSSQRIEINLGDVHIVANVNAESYDAAIILLAEAFRELTPPELMDDDPEEEPSPPRPPITLHKPDAPTLYRGVRKYDRNWEVFVARNTPGSSLKSVGEQFGIAAANVGEIVRKMIPIIIDDFQGKGYGNQEICIFLAGQPCVKTDLGIWRHLYRLAPELFPDIRPHPRYPHMPHVKAGWELADAFSAGQHSGA
jgi:hypothetical protein